MSHKDANITGGKVLRDNLKSTKKNIIHEVNKTKTIYDLNTGRGVNISREGLFNGFRNLPTK